MSPAKPEIVITYCTQCQWLLRAAWLAQELLSTFADDLGQIVDLMRTMRETEARRHVREETPFYTGRRVSTADLAEVLR